MDNLIPVYTYIGQQFIGHKYRFKCDCMFALDVIGTVLDFEMHGQEVILIIKTDPKIIRIGLNHPNLLIQKIT